MSTRDSRILRSQLLDLLRGGPAHMSFEGAVEDLPPEFFNELPQRNHANP